MNIDFRSQYGIEKVQEFVATANTNRYTENDMFFAGKQLFRFDGTWMAAMMKNFNSDVDVYKRQAVGCLKAEQLEKGTNKQHLMTGE